MVPGILLQQVCYKFRRVRYKRNDFVVRHTRGPDHTDDSGERARVVRGRYYCKTGEFWIVVLIPDRDRNAPRLATTTQQLAEFLTSLGGRPQLTQKIHAG